MQPCWPRLSCHLISMVHIDTSDPTCNRTDLFYHAANNMVHIDTSDPTHNRANLVFHATQSLATQRCGVAINQFNSHMTQYLGVISQFKLSLAMSHVCACASEPTCTSIIKLSNYQFSSSIYYHIRTISQQPIHMSNWHKAVTSRFGKKLTRCSGTTSSLLLNKTKKKWSKTYIYAAVYVGEERNTMQHFEALNDPSKSRKTAVHFSFFFFCIKVI